MLFFCRILNFLIFIVIEIESWGPEITTKEIKEGLIFRRGYRGEKVAQDRRGYGMGLTDFDKLIRKMDGDITLSSRLQAKSGKFLNIFYIYLKCLKNEEIAKSY